MQRRVFCATWNCENQKPSTASNDFNRLISVAKRSGADIMAFGFQETKGLSAVDKSLVSDIAAALGMSYVQANKGEAMGGITKPKDGWTNTAICVFVKTDFLAEERLKDMKGVRALPNNGIYNRANWKVAKSTSQQAAATEGGLKKKLAGALRMTKGGAMIVLNYDGLRLAFISCHLDASSTQGRARQVAKILEASNKKFGGHKQCDATFLMGDLNYRLRPPHGLYKMTEVCDVLASDTDRENLYQVCDEFQARKDADFGPDWQFPDIRRANGSICFPTYKRTYVVSGEANPCVQMVRAAKAGATRATIADLAFQCYFESSGGRVKVPQVKMEKKFKFFGPKTKETIKDTTINARRDWYATTGKRGFWEIGWLDRIGFKRQGRVTAIRPRLCRDIPEVTLSDHTPVFLIADMTYQSAGDGTWTED